MFERNQCSLSRSFCRSPSLLFGPCSDVDRIECCEPFLQKAYEYSLLYPRCAALEYLGIIFLYGRHRSIDW